MNTTATIAIDAKRRWLQFSLRKMLIGVTAFACVMAWFAYERREAAAARASLAPLEKAGAHIGRISEPKFNWRMYLFGDNPRNSVHFICLDGMTFKEAELNPLTEFKALRNLRLSGTNVSDASIIQLEKLRQLEVLSVEQSKITQDGVKRLKNALPKCELHTSFDE